MEVLHQILTNTFNQDNRLRAEAEEALVQFQKRPQAYSILLQLISGQHAVRELRQAAAIVLKNKARDFWVEEKAREKGLIHIPRDEKEAIKQNLVHVLLVETDKSIKAYLAEVVRIISEFEFPEQWPTLIPTLMENIQNPDTLRVYNSLLALRKLVKRYEYKSKENRKPLDDIVQVCFPLLQAFMQHIIQNQSLDAAECMRIIMKIFWSCTQYSLPKASNIDPSMWFNFIANIVGKYLPEASENVEPFGQPQSIDDRKQWPWWKVNSISKISSMKLIFNLIKLNYLWIAEADDLAEPEFLETIMEGDTDFTLAYTDSKQIDEMDKHLADNYRYYYDNGLTKKLDHPGVYNGLTIIEDCLSIKNQFMNVSSVVFDKKSIQDFFVNNMDEILEFKVAGDWFVYVQLLKEKNSSCKIIGDSLNIHRRHSGSVTKQNYDVQLKEISRMHDISSLLVSIDRKQQDEYLNEVKKVLEE